MKVVLGLPHQTERVHARFMDSLMSLVAHSLNQGIEISRIATYRDNITFARNKIASKALRETKADYLFFMDDDMVFQPDTLTRLLGTGKQIVGGLTFIRTEPHEPSFFQHNVKTESYIPIYMWKPNELVECDALGMAATLIDMKVFEKMKGYVQEHKDIWGFFDNVGFRGEDISFCQKAREMDFEIFCDTSALVGHIGEKIVGYGDYKAMTDDKILNIKKFQAEKAYK